jgi:hypothetical protein
MARNGGAGYYAVAIPVGAAGLRARSHLKREAELRVPIVNELVQGE